MEYIEDGKAFLTRFYNESLSNSDGIEAFIGLVGIGVLSYAFLAPSFRRKKHEQRYPPSSVLRNKDPEYDYIIVGSGSAGSVLANRLARGTKKSVLLIEAGPELHREPFYHKLSNWLGMFQKEVDWDFTYGPEPYLNNRVLHSQRGKTTGGSSVVNAMMWVRGNRFDYDNWDALCRDDKSNPGWSWKDVLPFFKSIEASPFGDDETRGRTGETKTRRVTDQEETQAFVKAAMAAGHPANPDTNGHDQVGVQITEQNNLPGARQDSFSTFIEPIVEDTKNLTVMSTTYVRKVIFNGNTCTGVEVEAPGFGIRHIRAKCEVILSGGGVNSPQILLLSGVGPREELEHLDIPVIADNKMVGKKLQEHIGSSVLFTLKDNIAMHDGSGLNGTCFYQSSWTKANAPQRGADMQIVFTGGEMYSHALGNLLVQKIFGFAPKETIKGRMLRNLVQYFGYMFKTVLYKPVSTKVVGVNVVLNQTNSRGQLTLQSKDPHAPPHMVANLGQCPEDLERVCEGLAKCRIIGATPPLAQYILAEKEPGPLKTSAEDLSAYIRKSGFHCWHIASTCVMGSDPETSVVDPCLRVRGVKGLRVADASIMPLLNSGNTNAPSMMIGARAADIILKTSAH